MDWASLSRAARDAAYNNSAAVADSAGKVLGWAKASAALRDGYPRYVGIPYGPGERNRWDLFPAADPNAPCLVHIHGGYWQMRSREDFSCMAEGVLAHGWAAALPGYTLAPDATLTEIAREMRSAFDWLAAHGRSQGISGPIIVSGWSAGGHLASLMLDHPSIRAGLAISGLYELGPLRDTYLDQKLKLSDAEIEALSPLRLPAFNKTLALAYGTAELPALVASSRDFHAHRAGSHRQGSLIPVANADHFTVLEELRSPDGILTRTVLQLAAA